VTYDQVAKGITVEYTGGNYGAGKHDGRLEITDEGLKLYDLRESGKYLLYGDEHPSDAEELRQCLKSSNWDVHWDGEEEDAGTAGWGEEWGEGAPGRLEFDLEGGMGQRPLHARHQRDGHS